MLQSSLELAEKKGVVLVAYASQELKTHDEQGSADAGCDEHGIVGNVPGGGDEAGVDDVPVP